MPTYTDIPAGVLLSNLPGAVNDRFAAARSLERGANAAEPSVKITGLLWNRTDYPSLGDALLRWTGSAWTLLADPDFAQLNAGGTVALAANLPCGGHKLTGLAAGTTSGDSVRYEQVVLRSGGVLTGLLDCGGQRLTNLGAPTASSDAARLADTAPVAGSFSLFTPSSQDASNTAQVDLGFVPGLVLLRFRPVSSLNERLRAPWETLMFAPAAVNVSQHANPDVRNMSDVVVPGNLATNYRFTLTRRSSAPNGFEFIRNGSLGLGTEGADRTHTVDYVAWR
jgi:hypothetical protein